MMMNINLAIQVDAENRIINIGVPIPPIVTTVSHNKLKEELDMFIGKPNSNVARKMIVGKLLRLFESDTHGSKRF